MFMTIHIAAGSIALIAGAVALLTRKGGKLHRRGGLVFVVAMLAMSASAMPLAVSAQKTTSLMGGILTFYLVLTSFLTIRRPRQRFDWFNIVTAVVGFSAAIVFFSLGLEGLRSESGTINGLRPEAMFIFGSVSLLAALGDVYVTLARAVSRSYRIARHLWRMCFALLMAAVSFFLGQAQVLPELVRNSLVPVLIPLAVVLLMFYWILRITFGKGVRKTSR